MVKKKWYENDDLMMGLVILFGIFFYGSLVWIPIVLCNSVGWCGK